MPGRSEQVIASRGAEGLKGASKDGAEGTTSLGRGGGRGRQGGCIINDIAVFELGKVSSDVGLRLGGIRGGRLSSSSRSSLFHTGS